MLSEGESVADAANLANRAGGIVVGKLGTATVSRTRILDTKFHFVLQ